MSIFWNRKSCLFVFCWIFLLFFWLEANSAEFLAAVLLHNLRHKPSLAAESVRVWEKTDFCKTVFECKAKGGWLSADRLWYNVSSSFSPYLLHLKPPCVLATLPQDAMLQHSVLEGVCIGEETWVFVVLCLPFCASLYVVGLVLRGLQEEWCGCVCVCVVVGGIVWRVF